jgi:hypothetical protein
MCDDANLAVLQFSIVCGILIMSQGKKSCLHSFLTHFQWIGHGSAYCFERCGLFLETILLFGASQKPNAYHLVRKAQRVRIRIKQGIMHGKKEDAIRIYI